MTGGMTMFMNSAHGGMVSADTRRPNGQEVNTWEESIRMGELIGDEAPRLLRDSPKQIGGK